MMRLISLWNKCCEFEIGGRFEVLKYIAFDFVWVASNFSLFSGCFHMRWNKIAILMLDQFRWANLFAIFLSKHNLD